MAFLSIILLLVVAKLAHCYHKSKLFRLPPGPPADPFLGHIRLGKVYVAHAKIENLRFEGDIFHLNVLGRIMIILNSAQRSIGLLEKRSGKYSGRFVPSAVGRMAWRESLPFMGYDEDFQRHRRMFQQYFNKDRSQTYWPVQIREARVFLQNLNNNPDTRARDSTILTFVTSLIVRIMAGHQITSMEDPYVKLADEVSAATALTGSTGASILDIFPFRSLFWVQMPEWFPGKYYAQISRETIPKLQRLYDHLFDQVQLHLANGIARPSIMASQIEAFRAGDNTFEYTEEDIKGYGATAYFAGAETARVQEEIDQVIGSRRLTDFDDRGSLPYVENLVQEILRYYVSPEHTTGQL
ncbi:hypothetical protein H0H92_014250 [Tricholoma furcatifolium]|nr:hypothetical protein H0H92_014250 [Tricholoma furcatifolium]